MTCSRCALDPCACGYIETLLQGGRNEALADFARKQVRLPLPHRGGCPCVVCYSERALSWEERTKGTPSSRGDRFA